MHGTMRGLSLLMKNTGRHTYELQLSMPRGFVVRKGCGWTWDENTIDTVREVHRTARGDEGACSQSSTLGVENSHPAPALNLGTLTGGNTVDLFLFQRTFGRVPALLP